MSKTSKIKFLAIAFVGMSLTLHAQLPNMERPNLILTKNGVDLIKASLGQAPLFDQQLTSAITEVNEEMATGIHVPVPKDMAGGYTHERHKKNWSILQKAGVLFQVTDEEKYAIYIRDVLLAYAALYPTLPIHPTERSYATGKIFWQCLNDANWLVYVSQAYDCIYDWITPEVKETLNTQLFRPYADFLSIENPQFFNRIHNHSTWANAAVGMIGLVMDDEKLVHRALYGLPIEVNELSARDDDGGLIRSEDQEKAGFLAQLDRSFSPDGYFPEGPYYLRYALFPFLQFAQALANNQPDLGVLEYRDGILKKAVYALLNQTDFNGLFFPFNDALKGMSWHSREVVTAVDLAYQHFGRDPMLLSVAEKQGRVLLDEAGFLVARDLVKGLAQPFKQKSIAYRDGSDGLQGGVAILRTQTTTTNEQCLVMKYSEQGMGHGHFDKLSYSLYDETGEVMQDYGAARWVGIDQKAGGRYLPENESWAKQSIAHNTMVIDETSHYNGDVQMGEQHHPDLYYFNADNENLQVVSAKSKHAYSGCEMHRTMIMLKDEALRNPILIDVFKAQSDTNHQYDLPSWFQGHLLECNFKYDAATNSMTALGDGHGYQHVWQEAIGKSSDGLAKLTWLSSNRKFFSMTSVVDAEDELIFARLGANDPNFNLRHDPAFLIRKKGKPDATYVSIIEPHGENNPVSEIPEDRFTSVSELSIVHDDNVYTIIRFKNKSGKIWTLALANNDPSQTSNHELKSGDEIIKWTGPFSLQKI